MKKIIAISLALLLALSLAACGGNNDPTETTEPMEVTEATEATEPTEPDEPTDVDDPAIGGGWTTPEKLAEAELAEETADMFTKACEKSEKELTPVALLGTQVVAGTNYAFLCTETDKPVIAIISKNLEGEAEVLSVKEFDLTAVTEAEPAGTEEPVSGGWTIGEEVTANNIGEEAQKALEAALAGFAGMNYEPIALVGTQVVAGINYAILCKGHAVIPNATSSLYLVKVFAGVDGTAEISSATALNIADYNG